MPRTTSEVGANGEYICQEYPYALLFLLRTRPSRPHFADTRRASPSAQEDPVTGIWHAPMRFEKENRFSAVKELADLQPLPAGVLSRARTALTIAAGSGNSPVSFLE